MELLHCYTRVTLLHSCYTVTLVELAYHPFSLGGGLGVTARAVSWRPPTGGCRCEKLGDLADNSGTPSTTSDDFR
eukprot:4133902-Pyramimonas_sp.AAC.1